MLNDKQKAIVKLCRSADQSINQALVKGQAFFLCLMFVNPNPPFTEFLVLRKSGGHTFISHLIKPNLVIRRSGVSHAS